MMNETNLTGQARKKILFLCFGYSIHAFRRIKIFTEDPSFDVTVVSTYNYKFENALNIHLKTPLYGKSQTDPGNSINTGIDKGFSFFSKLLKLISKVPFILNILLFLYDITLFIRHLCILKHCVKKIKPEAVFLQTLLYSSYLSFFLPKKTPIIITFWNGDIIWWAKWNGIERFFKKKIVSYGIKRAAAITVNSQSAFDVCLSYKIDNQKINLIRYPGIDLNNFKQMDKDLAKKELGLGDRTVVLCPRGYKSGNDYLNNDIIVKAAKELINQQYDILFLFVGINLNSDWEGFYNSAENIRFKDNFRNDGFVEWRKMAKYYSASDVVISLSSNDSQPNCMLEAMACKLPNIVGDIPPIREWITNGENGFIVPCRDSSILAQTILKVLEMKPQELNIITENAYELVASKADFQKNVERIKNLVKTI
jgi:glycosyltransferase involved in cell wall biosynthesis